jgi:hypothetical protein
MSEFSMLRARPRGVLKIAARSVARLPLWMTRQVAFTVTL